MCPAGLAWGEKASCLKDTNSKHTSMPAQPTAAPLHALWPPEKAGRPLAACPLPPHHLQGTGALYPQTTPASCTCCLRAGLLKIVNLLWLKEHNPQVHSWLGQHLFRDEAFVLRGQCLSGPAGGPGAGSSPSLTRGPPGPQGALPRRPPARPAADASSGAAALPAETDQEEPGLRVHRSLPHLPIFSLKPEHS